ncbi:MAG: T9SS type A sorting domain-containing protein [Ignavibacteriaceae bacterium]
MKKSVLLFFFIMTVGTMLSFAQTVKISTYGVSPYDVETDSVEHYFNRTYSGLRNVGIETKVFLLAKSTAAFSNPTWEVIEKPTGSNVQFGSVKVVDTSNQIITFIPDVQGTYKIKFSSGAQTAEMTFNAALYLGVEGGPVSCKTCHQYSIAGIPDVYNPWSATGHALDNKKAFDGEFGFFIPSCMPCHTTGFDPAANNDGFDDFPFVFPSVRQPGVYNQLFALYPEAMGRSSIQCEACHGPGSNHLAQIDNAKIDMTLSADVCSYCHKGGEENDIPLQYDLSFHGIGEALSHVSNNATCNPCHYGKAFVNKLKGVTGPVAETDPITCATCHDPHDATNTYQLRIVTATMKNGLVVENAGYGGLCLNCHQSRVNATSYVQNYRASLTSRFGPHHGPQGDLLIGTNAYTWGETLDQSPHFADIDNTCIGCHMAENDNVLNPDLSVGGHTFNMVNALGQDNVSACVDCHGNIGTDFNQKKLYINGNADLDKNGVAEGLQIEVEGLMEQLAMLLPPYGSPNINVIDSTWTLDEAGALFNYKMIDEDRSFGMHNPRYIVGLLYLSIGKLGGTVSIDDMNSELPSSYTLSDNYPNPFNPTTTINFSIPEQTNVKVIIYDALGNQVDVIADGVKSAGNYSVKWNAVNHASGIYFYKLETDNFVQVRKMVLMK